MKCPYSQMSLPNFSCQNIYAKMSVPKCTFLKYQLPKQGSVHDSTPRINFSFNNLSKNLTEICLGRMLEGIQICHWHQSRWHKTCWERGWLKWWLQFKQQFWLQVRRSLWSHTWRPFQGKNLWLRGLLQRLIVGASDQISIVV